MSDDTALIERLLAGPNPHDDVEWQTEEELYHKACALTSDDIPGLIGVMQHWPDESWPDQSTFDEALREKAELLSVTAWRALGELRAEAAVAPLIEMLLAACRVYEETSDFDDWSFEELPYVFGKIGPEAFEPLRTLAVDQQMPQDARSIALRGLEEIAKAHPATREPIVAFLIEWMEQASEAEIDLNTTVLCSLVDLHATEAAAAIEHAFSRNVLDYGMMGDWEEVRKDLGAPSLGLPMPVEPFDSMRETRARSKELVDLLRTRASHDAEFEDQDFEDDTDEDDLYAASPAPLQRLEKIGRNDPCSCGSGKKYKKCCGRAF